MPRFSIIIPAYKTAPFLPSCLRSISEQDFEDWEAIVVVDASPDDSAAVARAAAADDSRITVIEKPVNEGLHLARRTGTAQATGDYVTYLDSDDELVPGTLAVLSEALEKDPCDLLRFGTHVIPVGASQEACDAYQTRANKPFETMTGQQSVQLSYEQASGYVQDWRACTNVLSGDLAKRAFEAMCATRLERAEDSYEFLVFASLAKKQVTRTDIVGYGYNFGCGITGVEALPAEKAIAHAKAFAACMKAIDDYAASFDAFDLSLAARGARIKLAEIMFNDWKARVPRDEKEKTYDAFVELFGPELVAGELMRLARDESYSQFISGTPLEGTEEFLGWHDKSLALMEGVENPTWRYRLIKLAAERTLKNLPARERLDRFEDQSIRIFASTHLNAAYFDSDILQPIQVGASRSAVRFPDCLHDDEGDNISDLNPLYCELTAQYWAWKNVDAEYYGFCHYRRYFDFAEQRHRENAWGEVMDERIGRKTQLRYGLDDASIRKAVQGYDVITTEVKDLSDFPDNSSTPLDQWHNAEHLTDEDLIDTFAITCALHPEYAPDVEAFANGTSSCFCNMFIMRKDIFHDYCAWLFPILEQFCDTHDMSNYSHEGLRTPGHLSERLLNIYLAHHERIGTDWKRKQVQCVHFEHPFPRHELTAPPEWDVRGRSIVPVVFASDNNYVPMLTTTIHSMLENASPDRFYDITILTTDITGSNQQVMREFLTDGRAAALNFLDVKPLLRSYELSTNNPHIGIETYYRFLIQDVLPYYDKVLYLDSDLIVEGDVADLYDTELEDKLLGAVCDVDYLGMLNTKSSGRYKYSKEILEMDDPYQYFQAGVLVLNTRALRDSIPVGQWLAEAQDERYIFNDQDILNKRCEGRVVYLDPRWNVMHNGWNRIGNVCKYAPADAFDAYQKAREGEYIIHYAGSEKPWNTFNGDRAAHYWRYARETPFYEELVAILGIDGAAHRAEMRAAQLYDQPVISEDSLLRKVADPLMPLGSRRREAARVLMQHVKGIR